MPPKAAARSGGRKSAQQDSKQRTTRGGGSHSVNYAEEDLDEDKMGFVGGGEDEEDDDDPVSTAELQKVIKAFSKSKASKDKANANKVTAQCEKLLVATETSVKKAVKDQLAQCDEYMRNLHLEDETISGMQNSAHYHSILEKLEVDSEAQVKVIEEVADELDPANHLFYQQAKEVISDRPAIGKHVHRKLRRAADIVLAEPAQMAQLYAGAAPGIIKGFKQVIRAGSG